MRKKKPRDCVAMKNSIQAKHAAEFEGMTDQEVRDRIQKRLAESDDVVARKWRRLARQPQEAPTGR